MTEIKTNAIPHRLRNVNKEHPYVSGAKDIYDDVKGKSQEQVNKDADAAILAEKSRAEAVEAFHQSQINALDSQNYYTVEATQADTTINSVMSRAGVIPQIDTIYRVGSWDGTQYDTTCYSEYAWDAFIEEYRFLDKKQYGVDDEPRTDSNNLINSGGVAKIIENKDINTNNNNILHLTDNTGAIIGIVDKNKRLNWLGEIKAKKMSLEVSDFLEKQEKETNYKYEIVIVDNTGAIIEFFTESLYYNINLHIGNNENNENNEDDVYQRNIDKDPVLMSAAKYGSEDQRFQLLVITDTHGNNSSVNNAKIAAEKFKSLSAVIHLGDMTTWNPRTTDDLKGRFTALLNEVIPTYFVAGNHEVGEGTRCIEGGLSDKEIYDMCIVPMIQKGYLREGEWTENKLYYFHDFTGYNVKLIVLNNFDDGCIIDDYNDGQTQGRDDRSNWIAVEYDASKPNITSGTIYNAGDVVNVPYYTEHSFKANSEITITSTYVRASTIRSNEMLPCFKTIRSNRWFSQAQLTWFADQLVDAAAKGYKVIIAQHFPFSPNGITDKEYAFTNDSVSGIMQYNNRYFHNNDDETVITADADIISNIVDAYMRGENFVSDLMTPYSGEDKRIEYQDDPGTYLFDDCSMLDSFIFEYDFRSVENPSLCTYINGHYHHDYVYHNNAPRKEYQTGVSFLSGVVENNNNRDIFRNYNDSKTMDALTAFTIIQDSINIWVKSSEVTESDIVLRTEQRTEYIDGNAVEVEYSFVIRERGKAHLCRIGNDVSTKILHGKLAKKDNEIINI